MDSLVAYYNQQYAAILKARLPTVQKRVLVARLNNFVLPKVRQVKATLGTVTKQALVIGTNYPGTMYELKGCDNDVHSLKTFFEQKGFTVTTLCDDTTPPTKQTILDTFARVLRRAEAGSTVAVTFSCHGSYQRGPLETEQLVIPLDFKPISDVELKNVLRANLKKGVTVFAMFDSCFSGSTLNLRYRYLQSDRAQSVDDTKDETVSTVVALSGCTDNQTSADASFNGVPNGALTKAFLSTPKGSFLSLVQNVRKFMRDNRFSQQPQLESGQPLNLASLTPF